MWDLNWVRLKKEFFFLPLHRARGILVPWPWIKPMPPALEAWSLNHWTIRNSCCIILTMFTDIWLAYIKCSIEILLFPYSYSLNKDNNSEHPFPLNQCDTSIQLFGNIPCLTDTKFYFRLRLVSYRVPGHSCSLSPIMEICRIILAAKQTVLCFPMFEKRHSL